MTRRTWPPDASISARACAFMSVDAFERQAQRAPAHGRILRFVADVGQIGQRLVAADVDRAEDDRLSVGRSEHLGIEPLLAVAAGQRRGNEELELGSEQADAVRARRLEVRRILGKAGIDHDADRQGRRS